MEKPYVKSKEVFVKNRGEIKEVVRKYKKKYPDYFVFEEEKHETVRKGVVGIRFQIHIIRQ